MTWKEFVQTVEEQLKERGFSPDTKIRWLDWDLEAFGGPEPGVYVGMLDGRLFIGED